MTCKKNILAVILWYCEKESLNSIGQQFHQNLIGGVLVIVLASSVVDRGFESRSCQSKDYKIGICCFSAKHTALRTKIKDWLSRNQDNVSEWGDMSIRGLLFQ